MPLFNKSQPNLSQGRKVFAHVNNTQEFQPYLDSMDINQELDTQQITHMKQILVDNLKAFAFGSKKLGQTNLITMSQKMGTANPSQPLLIMLLQLDGNASRTLWQSS